MGKKADKGDRLGKSEKLDLILAELAKLRAEVKVLTKQQSGFTAQIGKLAAKTSVGSGTPKSSVRKPQPKRPVLVAASSAPAARTSSQ